MRGPGAHRRRRHCLLSSSKVAGRGPDVKGIEAVKRAIVGVERCTELLQGAVDNSKDADAAFKNVAHSKMALETKIDRTGNV